MIIERYISSLFIAILLVCAILLPERAYSQVKEIDIITATGITAKKTDNPDPATGATSNSLNRQTISYEPSLDKKLIVADMSAAACKDEKGLFNKIVTCTQNLVNTSIINSNVIPQLYTVFQDLGSAAVVLYIMFFGLKIMSLGVDNFRSEAFIVFITAALIVYFNQATQIATYRNVFLSVQQEFIEIATKGINTAEINSLSPSTGDANDCVNLTNIPAGELAVWHKVDCLIPRILGAHPLVEKVGNCFGNIFDKSNATGLSNTTGLGIDKTNLTGRGCQGITGQFNTKEEFYASKNTGIQGKLGTRIFTLFVILIGTVFNSDFGFIIIITGLFIPILMIVAFGQAVYIYLTSFIGITILALFAPIVLPCFLFRYTRQIFDQWLKILVSLTLKPGILFVYLTFMVYILSAVISYGSTAGSAFRSYSDFVSGATFENSTVQQTLWARITTKYANESFCYERVKEQKGVTEVVSVAEKASQNAQTRYFAENAYVSGLASTVVSNKNSPEYLKVREGISEEYKFNRYVESILDQYYGSVPTQCQQSQQQLKVFKFNFGDANNLEAGVDGILREMIRKPFIATAASNVINQAGINIPGSSILQNNGVQSLEDLKKAIVKNDPVFPTLNNIPLPGVGLVTSARYGDIFVEEFNKFLQRQQNAETEFFVSLLIVLIVLAITFTFMNNVIEFGDQMAGLAGAQAMKMSNIYGMVSQRFNAIITK